jgi:hypothetical protein
MALQRLQQIPPLVLFGQSRWTQAVFRALLPVLVRTAIAGLAFAGVFRRFAQGVSDVRLRVS